MFLLRSYTLLEGSLDQKWNFIPFWRIFPKMQLQFSLKFNIREYLHPDIEFLL